MHGGAINKKKKSAHPNQFCIRTELTPAATSLFSPRFRCDSIFFAFTFASIENVQIQFSDRFAWYCAKKTSLISFSQASENHQNHVEIPCLYLACIHLFCISDLLPIHVQLFKQEFECTVFSPKSVAWMWSIVLLLTKKKKSQHSHDSIDFDSVNQRSHTKTIVNAVFFYSIDEQIKHVNCWTKNKICTHTGNINNQTARYGYSVSSICDWLFGCSFSME